MNNRMPCSVSDGADYDDLHDEVPELDDLEKELVLLELDEDWETRYGGDSHIAWERMYELNQPEMDALAVEIRKKTIEAERAERTMDLDDVLFDIATPALGRRQGW